MPRVDSRPSLTRIALIRIGLVPGVAGLKALPFGAAKSQVPRTMSFW